MSAFLYRPNHPEADEFGMVPKAIAGTVSNKRSFNAMPDFDEYQSPSTGKWIGDRAARREDLKASGCVEFEPTFKGKPKGLINERFVKKHGLQHMMTPEAREKYERNGR